MGWGQSWRSGVELEMSEVEFEKVGMDVEYGAGVGDAEVEVAKLR